MLFLHEVHEVVGRREDEFEALFRDAWRPELAKTGDARLLHFLRHAHGSGPSYQVVTVTAARDGAFEGLLRRADSGDLAELARRTDALRHDVHGKLLVPLPWSPLQAVDLDAAPAPPESGLYMEDTVWPYEGQLEAYVQRAGAHYAREMAERAREGVAILEVQAAFRTAWGAGRRREVVLWQRILRAEALVPLIAREVPARYRAPGTWMHDALDLRDRWQSRLLRAASWSPGG